MGNTASSGPQPPTNEATTKDTATNASDHASQDKPTQQSGGGPGVGPDETLTASSHSPEAAPQTTLDPTSQHPSDPVVMHDDKSVPDPDSHDPPTPVVSDPVLIPPNSQYEEAVSLPVDPLDGSTAVRLAGTASHSDPVGKHDLVDPLDDLARGDYSYYHNHRLKLILGDTAVATTAAVYLALFIVSIDTIVKYSVVLPPQEECIVNIVTCFSTNDCVQMFYWLLSWSIVCLFLLVSMALQLVAKHWKLSTEFGPKVAEIGSPDSGPNTKLETTSSSSTDETQSETEQQECCACLVPSWQAAHAEQLANCSSNCTAFLVFCVFIMFFVTIATVLPFTNYLIEISGEYDEDDFDPHGISETIGKLNSSLGCIQVVNSTDTLSVSVSKPLLFGYTLLMLALVLFVGITAVAFIKNCVINCKKNYPKEWPQITLNNNGAEQRSHADRMEVPMDGAVSKV